VDVTNADLAGAMNEEQAVAEVVSRSAVVEVVETVVVDLVSTC